MNTTAQSASNPDILSAILGKKERSTLQIALVVAVAAMIGRAYLWIAIPLTLFAIFLILWGKDGKNVEAAIGRMPGGRYALLALEQLDLLLSPRDREYERYIRAIILRYERDQQQSLRVLWLTRSSSSTPNEHLNRFVADGFIEYPKDGPGWIKPDIRTIVDRTLDELGV